MITKPTPGDDNTDLDSSASMPPKRCPARPKPMARGAVSDSFWVRYEPRRVLLSLLGTTYAAELAHHRLCALE